MFEALDFLYMPSADPAADRDYFVDILGARAVFAIQAGDERVAAVTLSDGPPLLLFAAHLAKDSDKQRPFLIYRVGDFNAALNELEANGWTRAEAFEIPHGPCCTFETSGGHRIGVYQLTRPEVAQHFEGRRDF